MCKFRDQIEVPKYYLERYSPKGSCHLVEPTWVTHLLILHAKQTKSPRKTGQDCSTEFWMLEGAAQNQIAKTVQERKSFKMIVIFVWLFECLAANEGRSFTSIQMFHTHTHMPATLVQDSTNVGWTGGQKLQHASKRMPLDLVRADQRPTPSGLKLLTNLQQQTSYSSVQLLCKRIGPFATLEVNQTYGSAQIGASNMEQRVPTVASGAAWDSFALMEPFKDQCKRRKCIWICGELISELGKAALRSHVQNLKGLTVSSHRKLLFLVTISTCSTSKGTTRDILGLLLW